MCKFVPENCTLRSQGTAFTSLEDEKLRFLWNGSMKYLVIWLVCFSFYPNSMGRWSGRYWLTYMPSVSVARRVEIEIAMFWISSAMNQSLSKISPTFSVSIFIVIASIYDSTDYYQRSLNFSFSYLELLQIFPSTQVIYLICCDKYILIFKAKYRTLYLFVNQDFIIIKF